MARIGFIGLGNMGLPMAQNLIKAGHAVSGFDVSEYAAERLAPRRRHAGEFGEPRRARAPTIVITMLPAGEQVREVYLGDDGVLAAAPAGTLLIDCSTIDVETARDGRAGRARRRGLAMLDAPVSGGVAGAQAGTLTFMVGGPDARFRARASRARSHGQDHRPCRRRRQRPGREDLQQHDPRRLDDRGVGGVPAGREARPRRAEAVRHLLEVVRPVLVDDELLPGAGAGAGVAREPRLQGRLHRRDDAQGSRSSRRRPRATAGASTPLGAGAAAVYEQFVESGDGGVDFSGIIRFLRGALRSDPRNVAYRGNGVLKPTGCARACRSRPRR